MTHTDLHIFGIRHHGPGSAQALVEALTELEPDIVLVEGPADADPLLSWLDHIALEPPVALVMYRTDEPQRAAYFPFARFSPEYQAIRYAQQANIPVRFMDLPQSIVLALQEKFVPPDMEAMQELARLAGFPAVEPWWNAMVEQRQDRRDIFAAILELMTTARETPVQADKRTSTDTADPAADPAANLVADSIAEAPAPGPSVALNDRREAFMRQAIRQARAAGHTRIAIVCGAFHGPALRDPARYADDELLLHGLPTAPVEGAWTPWTYGRLALASGYGSGIRSPGWYDHLWTQALQQTTPTESSIMWLTQVAGLLRDEGMDTSSAHIIEAVRLAESLAALRGLALAGLPELTEATQAVLCFGRSEPLDLIQRKLIVGERMGRVPPDAPMTPLQRDLYRLQRELALHPEPEARTIALDLRKTLDHDRSRLLHRLNLLRVSWGKRMKTRNQIGTFQENWRLAWQPEFAVRIIEASVWGTTVERAAAGFVQHEVETAEALPDLTALLDEVLLADLAESVALIIARIEEMAARNADILHMMGALPPLAGVLRYGSVRQTDKQVLRHVVDSLLTRICLGLPGVCAALNDDAAADVESHISQVHSVVATLQNEAHTDSWQQVLSMLLVQPNVHGLIGGRSCRLLFDARVLDADEALRHLERNLSVSRQTGADLSQAAHWLDGFLKGGGLLLIHDHDLWTLLDRWVMRLEPPQFMMVAPLLRRTFAGFSENVRQQLSERVQHVRPGQPDETLELADFDHTAAARVVPFLAEILGVAQDSTGAESGETKHV